jgi:vanillate monooxygenase
LFLKNCWYVACTSDEFAEKPLSRKICGNNIVFYRGPEEKVAALEDFCPHRGAPLSLGSVENGLLVCGYHGLAMGPDGKTDNMPGQKVDRFRCIKSFPVEERYGFVWVWPGEASLADPTTIPIFEWGEEAGWAYGGGLYHVQCDYRLMIDNLMDLSHETYVHSSSIGQREIDEAPVSTEFDGDTVTTSRYMENIVAPPFWKMALRSNDLADDVPVDRWQICRFSPPSHVMIDVGVAHAGKGGFDADPKYKSSGIVVDFITPETDTSIWYFWGMARNFKPNDVELTAQIRKGQQEIFAEDLEMLEGQQRNLLENPELQPMKLNIDSGGVHSRKILDRLNKQESNSTPSADA